MLFVAPTESSQDRLRGGDGPTGANMQSTLADLGYTISPSESMSEDNNEKIMKDTFSLALISRQDQIH